MKIFVLILILIFGHSIVIACSCVNTSNISDEQHRKYLKNVKAIFYGEVLSVGEKVVIEYETSKGISYTNTFQPIKFKVLRAWKGVEQAEVTVNADAGSSCKYVPLVGNKITVYAFENKFLNTLAISYCSIGKYDDNKMKREYGEGKVFEEPQQIIETTESFWSRLWQKIVSFFS